MSVFFVTKKPLSFVIKFLSVAFNKQTKTMLTNFVCNQTGQTSVYVAIQ